MISNRYIFGFAIFAFAMAFLLLACSGVFQLSGRQGGGLYVMLSLPWIALGTLAAWVYELFKHQSKRLNRLESQLRAGTAGQK